MDAEAPRTIRLTIDGREVAVPAGSTIWQAARKLEIDIPVLCHQPRLRPIGVCRTCLVDVGEKKMTASCIRKAEDGMEVRTSGEMIERCRKGLVELLLSDYPVDAEAHLKTGRDELLAMARQMGVAWPPTASGNGHGRADGRTGAFGDGARTLAEGRTRPVGGLPEGSGRPIDASSPVIHVDHQACIMCDRCIRACDEVQVNDVIGRTGKGYTTRISFDLDDPMGRSSCVACGECEKVCPTGALALQDLFEAGGGPKVGAAAGAQDGWEYL